MGKNGIESESSDAAPREPSQFKVPRISLPEGGGAIPGIDDKFTANPATGTGSLTIPLSLGAGRSGFGRLLSLTYDSGQGNDPFGIGWSFLLPKIALGTDNGLPCYGKDLIDIRHDMPDAWQSFQDCAERNGMVCRLDLCVERRMFQRRIDVAGYNCAFLPVRKVSIIFSCYADTRRYRPRRLDAMAMNGHVVL